MVQFAIWICQEFLSNQVQWVWKRHHFWWSLLIPWGIPWLRPREHPQKNQLDHHFPQKKHRKNWLIQWELTILSKEQTLIIFSHDKKIHHFDPPFSDPVSHLDSRHILVLSSGCWLITGWAPLWCHPKYWWCQTCLPGIRCSSRGQWTDRGNWPTDSGQFLAIDDIYGWKIMGNWWFINGFRDMFETKPIRKTSQNYWCATLRYRMSWYDTPWTFKVADSKWSELRESTLQSEKCFSATPKLSQVRHCTPRVSSCKVSYPNL